MDDRSIQGLQGFGLDVIEDIYLLMLPDYERGECSIVCYHVPPTESRKTGFQ